MAAVASGGGLPPSGNGGGGGIPPSGNGGFRPRGGGGGRPFLRKGKKGKGQKVTERWSLTQEQ